MRHRLVWAALLGIMPALLIPACGGGGGSGGNGNGNGGGPTPEGPFLGSYHYLMLDRKVTADAVRSETGQVTANGLGALVFGDSYAVEAGAASGPFTRSSIPYAVTGGRDLTLTESGGRTLGGVVATDGLLASATALTTGDDPAWCLFMRRATSPSQADLAGIWYLFSWAAPAAADEDAVAERGRATIDATGTMSVSSFHYNLDGEIDPIPPITFPEQLLVDTGGWLIRRRSPTTPTWARGGISEGRDLILLGQSGGGAPSSAITILVRAGQASNESALSGEYGAASFESIGNLFGCGAGPMTFNGVDRASWAATYNADGATQSDTLLIDFSVDPDGWAEFEPRGVVLAMGGVGPGGRYAVWGGYWTAGASPVLQFLIR